MTHGTAEGVMGTASHCGARQAWPCHVLPSRGVSLLYRKNKETHLIYREKERGQGTGKGKAKARARQPKAE